ncbi:Bromodomain-containing protein [Xylariaceae sp. FL0594]|nr:Bromodomain-containing protein [Xylariaceae sp. FL0594]
MASEEPPRSLSREEQKPDSAPVDAMEVDEPIVKPVDGADADGLPTKAESAPITNGDSPKAAEISEDKKDGINDQNGITTNGTSPLASAEKKQSDKPVSDAPVPDTTDSNTTKQVNGIAGEEDSQSGSKAAEKANGEEGQSGAPDLTEEPTPTEPRLSNDATSPAKEPIPTENTSTQTPTTTEAQAKAPEDARKEDAVDAPMPDPPPDSMDVDVSTERPDLESSAEHANSTQNTSATSDAAALPPSSDVTQSADVSKLEVKATLEADEAISPTQVDVVMPEAPPSPGKVSRSREDDDVDEPLAKRAKTEDGGEAAEDSSVVVASNPPASDAATPRAGGDGSQYDIPDNLPIAPFQNRRLREVLGNVKKTKDGFHFKKSVQDLWPHLWNDYIAKIDNPVDISLMEARLREGKYSTYGDFKADVHLLYQNAVTYNGATHQVTDSAANVREYIFKRVPDIIQSKPPAKPEKGKAHPIRYAEPRVVAQPRRQSQSQAPPPSPKPKGDASSLPSSTPASATAQTFAIPPSGIPQIRRDSTREDHDRPKRPIHPPKNRDPDYGGSKASRKKKLDPDQRFIDWALEEVKKPKHIIINQWFLEPVDPVALNIPTYFSVVKKPMDLGTMTEKNYDGKYKSVKDVEKDMGLIVTNSELFNGKEHEVTKYARQLEELLKSYLAQKNAWMARHFPSAPSGMHASAASPDASDAESDDESDGDAHEEDSDAIQNLQQRLNEEQEKLNKLLDSKKPDLTMMEIQQSMITMLQRKLVEQKTKSLSEKKPKKKKSGSKSKSKVAGNGLHGVNKRSSGNASSFKKSSHVSKKPAPPKKRVIGAMEKAVIAEGINDLDGTTLTRAVDIIKRDTGQAENDEGEMELDIDSLTSDALGKLYDLINKAHPHFRQVVAKRPEFSSQLDGDSEAKAKAGGAPPKPKKNKPMNKQEQERKIEQLRELKAQLQRGGSASQEPTPATPEVMADAGDTSEESDSEEE